MKFIHKGKILATIIVAILLTVSFFAPTPYDEKTDYQVAEQIPQSTVATIPDETEAPISAPDDTNKQNVPEEKNEIKEDQEEKKPFCTITVRCDTILSNSDKMSPEKKALVPADGVILKLTKSEILNGDTAFTVLERELKNNKIHLEFQGTTVYDSVYIEGIGNLYEFDCGNLSGWIYRVNGEVPSVGCSLYEIKDGDKIEFLYTCNMGRDLE